MMIMMTVGEIGMGGGADETQSLMRNPAIVSHHSWDKFHIHNVVCKTHHELALPCFFPPLYLLAHSLPSDPSVHSWTESGTFSSPSSAYPSH